MGKAKGEQETCKKCGDTGHKAKTCTFEIDNMTLASTPVVKYASAFCPLARKCKHSEADVFIFGSLACRDAVSHASLLQLLDHANFKVFDVNFRKPFYEKDLVISLMHQADFIKCNDEELPEICTYIGVAATDMESQVRELAASADPVTRTYAVKLALEASERLPLGSTVNVKALQLPGSQAGVIKLPTSALRQEGAGTAVWVLDAASMTVRSQSVQVGVVDGNEVVITSGLQPGQQVVSAGVHVLSPGQKVTIYNATGKAASASPASASVSAESAAPAQDGASAAQR